MPTTHIQPVRSPDHGFGFLGSFAHAVTADYLEQPPLVPDFHGGYNTLPDPPYPMTARLWRPLDAGESWQACEGDMELFLETGVASMRAQPPGKASDYDEQTRSLQYLMRLDAMALAWKARYFNPADSVATWTLAADLLAGKAIAGDVTPELSAKSVIVWVVDREGGSLIGWLPEGGTEDDIEVLVPGIDEDDVGAPEVEAATLLREILLAQYAWTVATFGAGPPPNLAPIADGLRSLPRLADGKAGPAAGRP